MIYILAIYEVTENRKKIEEGSFFMQTRKLLSAPEIREYIRKEEGYSRENISVVEVLQINEQMYRDMGGTADLPYFKII
jgi:hypothetical protein